MSNLLALDQSSRVTGWAVFKDGQLFRYGKFEATSEDLGERLCYIRQQVASLISQYEVNEVILEDIQLQSNVVNNVATFKILAEVFGVIYELLEELHIKNSAMIASTWKSILNIKGKTRPEQKKNAAEYVAKTYGVTAIQDVCDAICIGAASFNTISDFFS